MLGGEILTEKFQTKEITGYVWIILAWDHVAANLN